MKFFLFVGILSLLIAAPIRAEIYAIRGTVTQKQSPPGPTIPLSGVRITFQPSVGAPTSVDSGENGEYEVRVDYPKTYEVYQVCGFYYGYPEYCWVTYSNQLHICAGGAGTNVYGECTTQSLQNARSTLVQNLPMELAFDASLPAGACKVDGASSNGLSVKTITLPSGLVVCQQKAKPKYGWRLASLGKVTFAYAQQLCSALGGKLPTPAQILQMPGKSPNGQWREQFNIDDREYYWAQVTGPRGNSAAYATVLATPRNPQRVYQEDTEVFAVCLFI
jgi:hypothetical protein